jgi:hypothetical protein
MDWPDVPHWSTDLKVVVEPVFQYVGPGGLHPAREYQPSTGPVKGSKILWPHPHPLGQPLTPIEPLHGQSILEVLRTRPLTAPAPGSDRRLSGEAHQVGRHSLRSDHEPQGSLPGLQGRRTGTRSRLHLRRERAHLHARDLPDVPRNRAVGRAASQEHRAIGVPLTPGLNSAPRSLTGSRPSRSGRTPRSITAICKQVLGPPSVESSCHALHASEVIRSALAMLR